MSSSEVDESFVTLPMHHDHSTSQDAVIYGLGRGFASESLPIGGSGRSGRGMLALNDLMPAMHFPPGI